MSVRMKTGGESRLRARRRKRRVLFAILVIFLIAVIVGGSAYLMRRPFLRIDTVAISGASVVPIASIESTVENNLSGNYLFLYPKNNIFLYQKKPISDALTGQFPTLSSAVVEAENFHTISVSVTERQPVALWCGEVVASSSNCYLMDKTGAAYAPAPEYSGGVYQEYFGALTATSSPQQFLTPTQFNSLFALVGALQKTEGGDAINNIAVDSNNDVTIAFSNGFDLMFALSEDPGTISQRFALALTADPFTSHKLSEFQYLDLRFGDKVYYKLN